MNKKGYLIVLEKSSSLDSEGNMVETYDTQVDDKEAVEPVKLYASLLSGLMSENLLNMMENLFGENTHETDSVIEVLDNK